MSDGRPQTGTVGEQDGVRRPAGAGERSTRDKVRALWAYARPHKAVLVVALVLGAIGTATELATPLVTKAVLDGLEASASLATPITILAVLLVAGTVVGLVQGIMLGTLAERIILAARTGLVRHLLHARVPEVTARQPGELVTRVTSDTLLIREATTSSVVNFVNGIIGLVGAIVLMAYLDVVLLGVTVAVLIVAGISVVALMPRLSRAQQEAQEHVGALGGRLEGVIRALRTVKSARAESRETGRVSAHAEASARSGIRAVKLENVSWTITGVAVNLAVMLLLGVGAWRVSTDAITVSTLVAFLLYVFQLMMPVMLLTMSLTSLQSGLAAAARISEVEEMRLEADDDAAAAAGASGAEPGSGGESSLVRLREVTYRYPGEGGVDDGRPPALDGVSIDVPRRGHTAIVGPSGAGKTTIMSLLLRFLSPETGRVELDGRPYADWTTDQIRSRIAYVEQDTPIVPGTLRENLAYAAPGATDAQIRAAVDALRLTDRVAVLPDGLDTEVSASQLSGGERQRVAVARALVARPEILLLDEATAQLDGLTEAALAEAIRDVASTGAVVTIAHRISTVMDADQIVLLERGRVRAVGRHTELLETDELYRELVAALRLDASVTGSVSVSGQEEPAPAGA
ncbi:ABC transporter ATP-binding protein [Promicromonospora sukumoe]|uniref:ATP-binding cassette subfamily B protein n=1 Tax=Promicromonospora sukumoe TaxID=88382 RepID=A0A7W3J903_9MICO|nr:ABC transporter ATP-binding protein [Promicromonospora sukumoe]MBA8808329.1 ATP-binding cassette subfamily B protein [Promicromonospora sukumoe]